MDLQIRKQTNPVHPLTSRFFCTFPSYFPVKILGASPVSHISSVFQTFIFPIDFITKILFRKNLPPVLFVLLARQQLKLRHPALQHSQITHHYPTKLLFRSRVTMAHAYHQCTETRRPPGRLFRATEPNWNFSFKLFTCQEQYLCSHWIKLLMP